MAVQPNTIKNIYKGEEFDRIEPIGDEASQPKSTPDPFTAKEEKTQNEGSGGDNAKSTSGIKKGKKNQN